MMNVVRADRLFRSETACEGLRRVRSNESGAFLTKAKKFAPVAASIGAGAGANTGRAGFVVVYFDERPITNKNNHNRPGKAHSTAVVAHGIPESPYDSSCHIRAEMWRDLGGKSGIDHQTATNRLSAGEL